MKRKIIITLIFLIMLSTMSGCLRAPISRGFKVIEVALPNSGVYDVPKGVKITYYWYSGEDKIIVTFNKDIDPSQKTPLFFYTNGSVVDTVLSEKDKDEKEKSGYPVYYFYSSDKNRIVIQRNPKYPPVQLPSYNVTLVIPSEFMGQGGTTLQEDAFFFLSRYASCSPSSPPQFFIVKDPDIGAYIGAMTTITLPSTIDEKKVFAFLIKDVDLVSSPITKEKLKSLITGDNIEIIKKSDNWTKIAVYYPKYSSHDKEIQSMSSISFDKLLNSNFVERVEGYIPLDSFQIIPRPHNPNTFITASVSDIGEESYRPAISFTVSSFGAYRGYLDLGDKITEEQFDFLEMAALSSVMGSWQEWLGSMSSSLNGELVGYIMIWKIYWNEEEYGIFKRINREYAEKILSFIDNYKVNPKYEKWKKIFHEESEYSAKSNEALIDWVYSDKEKKIENLARYVSEAIGKTEEEKKEIYKTIITNVETVADGVVQSEGLIDTYNSTDPALKALLYDEIMIEERDKFFSIHF